MEGQTIGFYRLLVDAERKRLIGALLVTDELGKPEEFRVTYPVRPSVIQRQLYGDSLLTHVGVELCGEPLYAALRKKPPILLVSHMELLALASSIPGSVAHVEKVGATLALSEANTVMRARQEQVHSSSGRFEPIRVTYPVSYASEQQENAKQLIIDFFGGIDLLEPFHRIEVAIQVLQEHDEKFR
jgi:hypothetical protein